MGDPGLFGVAVNKHWVSLYPDADLCIMMWSKMAAGALSIAIISQVRDEVIWEVVYNMNIHYLLRRKRCWGMCLLTKWLYRQLKTDNDVKRELHWEPACTISQHWLLLRYSGVPMGLFLLIPDLDTSQVPWKTCSCFHFLLLHQNIGQWMFLNFCIKIYLLLS